ncbi:hypothetical protein [Oribacterium sp. WCC10]|uniref:hypothetical protein n=1 Tax=Oribacterium sp. WCC10 TaxID=1855343 RepID=UPI0008F40CF4|nr:hypothetical protein [Oribacterium sp. WCC10]SFG33891.1 hypothetical protein SAMN05216356_10633 [Oribacterium sp. WCC10]
MKRWYSEEKIAFIIRKEEFSDIYHNYLLKNMKYIRNEWVKDMKDTSTPNVTQEQFMNREIVGEGKWIRSQFAGSMGDSEEQFFTIYALDDKPIERSIVFTPFISVDGFGSAGFNTKRTKEDLSDTDKLYYILPDKMGYSDMISAVSGTVYTTKSLSNEYRAKLGEYLPSNFAIESHLGIISFTYEKEIPEVEDEENEEE